MRYFERMAPFRSHSVISLVPEGFQRYVRIFHPAWRNDPEHRIALCWTEIAHYTGAKPHALMQWDNISAPNVHGNPIFPPDEGTMPPNVSKPLRDLLFRHSNSSKCWLGVWPGFGGNYRKYVPDTAVIDTKYREWKIFRASLSEIDIAFFEGWDQTANLVWCDDFSWWITTGIDLNTTYMGGGEKLIQAVLDSPNLETWPAAPDDDISKFSDTINPIGDRDTDSAQQVSNNVKKAHKLSSRREWQMLQPNRKLNETAGPTRYYSTEPHKLRKWGPGAARIVAGMKKVGSNLLKLHRWIVLVIIGVAFWLFLI